MRAQPLKCVGRKDHIVIEHQDKLCVAFYEFVKVHLPGLVPFRSPAPDRANIALSLLDCVDTVTAWPWVILGADDSNVSGALIRCFHCLNLQVVGVEA